MIVAGCDVGSRTTKAVILKNNEIYGYEIISAKADSVASAREAMDKLLARLGLTYDELDYCIATGYGRSIIPFAQGQFSEVSCHGRGANWLDPEIRTIIDGGGQDFKGLRINEKGLLQQFRLNSKCAAGTGKAVERMAESLGVEVSELGPLSLQSTAPARFVNPCSVTTEMEIRHLIIDDVPTEDIAAGIINNTAHRILSVLRPLGFKKQVCVTGGIAKNSGIIAALEESLQVPIVRFPVDPQIMGALGAAVFAADKVKRQRVVADI